MNNIEQEYSFKVTDIKPFINYFKNNSFKKTSKTLEQRTLYRKKDKTLLRLTIKKSGHKIIKEMDFKEDILSNDVYIQRKESLPIVYTDDEAVNSVINFLGYEKHITLIRTRYIFKKEDLKVEIDDYISPNKMFVVAIEGNVNKTSKIYNELKEKYYKYFINI